MTIHQEFCLWLPIICGLAAWVFLQRYGRLPSADSVQVLLTSLNSKGGNIAVLTLLTFYFYHSSQHMYYVVIQQLQAGTLHADNPISLTGLQFATGAFGGVVGALLKVMSGDDPVKPNSKTLSVVQTDTPPSIPNEQSKEKQ